MWRLGAGSWREISGEVNPSGRSQAQGLITRVLFPSSYYGTVLTIPLLSEVLSHENLN